MSNFLLNGMTITMEFINLHSLDWQWAKEKKKVVRY